MSARACWRMPGRCTFTTTSRPSRSVARCTWPSDAAASGVLSETREQRRQTDAELGSAHEALDLVVPERCDVVLEA